MTIKQRITDIVANYTDNFGTQLLTNTIMGVIDQQLRDAARYRMVVRLSDTLNDEESTLSDAAEAIADHLEQHHGLEYSSQHSGQMMGEMLDLLITQFPE